MDSTNSGSIQSSSSGDNEEYDSRGETISSFLNLPPPQPPPTAAGTNTALQSHQLPTSSSIFDSFSPYLTPFPFPAPPTDSNSLALDSTWQRGIQPSSLSSYSTCTTLSPMMTAAARASAPGTATASPSSASSVQHLAQADGSATAGAPRGPKKRSRASRRAPTTVLNTDTSNFRAMVQQFTGFPTPPFAASSPFPRPRLDFFNIGVGTGVVPPYLLRPSAQKIPAAPFAPVSSSATAASSSLLDHTLASIVRSNLANINLPINTAATSSSSSATPSSSVGKCQLSLFDPQNTLDMQSTSFIPQSLLHSQATPEYNSHSLSTFRARPQGALDFAMGGLGSFLATDQGMKLSDRSDVLSGWVDEPGEENAGEARPKAIFRNYGNQS